MIEEDKIQRAAALVRKSKYMVAFTGAGSSTPSGIPDFRSPESGLWEKHNPMVVASIWSFRLKPETFFDWVRPLVSQVQDATPNPAHDALVPLEKQGPLKAIITQNIDGLHQQAGSSHVLELHGHMRDSTCIRCYRQEPAEPRIQQFMDKGKVPRCHCGGVLKPNVILFGEQLPIATFNQAQAEIRRSDLILVMGSSLEVTPAADLPFAAVDGGARSIIVNLQPTSFDEKADVVIHGDMAEILPQIVSSVQSS